MIIGKIARIVMAATVLWLMWFSLLPATEVMVKPAPVGTGPFDPMIPAPGMGWVANCWDAEIRATTQPIPSLNLENSLKELKEGMDYPYSFMSKTMYDTGNCHLIYVMLNWRDFEEMKETSLKKFLETIQAVNTAEPDEMKRFRVFFGLMFLNTCESNFAAYPDGWGIDSYPPYIENRCGCTSCPYTTDILGTYLLDSCDNPDWFLCLDLQEQPPYHARVQMRELNYFNPAVLPDIISNWNQEVADYVARFDCIAGVQAGFMGDWGEDHLAMFSLYGSAQAPRDWGSFRRNITAWFDDFKIRMRNNQRHLELFLSTNYNWQSVDFEAHSRGLIGPEESIALDMFEIPLVMDYTLVSASSQLVHPFDPNYDYILREMIRLSKPHFQEWDRNETLDDEFTYYPNYIQLNMCGFPSQASQLYIACNGLDQAVHSFYIPQYQLFKNRLGYRFQISSIRRDSPTTPKQVSVTIRNIADGFCINPVRLSLIACSAGGRQDIQQVVDLDPDVIRHLRRDDMEELEVPFSLPAPAESGIVWKVGLEVFDYWPNHYLPVNWSNREGYTVTDRITVVPLLGDLDENFVVDEADLHQLANWLAGDQELPLSDPGCADYNSDARVDLLDLVLMRHKLDSH